MEMGTKSSIMYKKAFLLAVFAGLLAVPAHALSSLKVGVYNIHGGVGSDGTTDLVRIGRVLKSAAPEVIGLNEVNRHYLGDNHDQVLASEMGPGWNAYFAKTLTKWYAAADYGNAIITSLPVISSQSWLLSEYPDQERRGLIRVTVEKNGEHIHIFNTHMGLDATMRAIHADEILSIMNSFTDGYKVLIGDFNEVRTGTSIEKFAAQLTDAWGLYGLGSPNTFSATNPTRRIDFIWLGAGLAATDCYVSMFPDARVASDHLPVFANVLTPGAIQPVANDISVRVNGQERLGTGDIVEPDPDAYTQGSVALVTSGANGPAEIVADNMVVNMLTPLYNEDFDNAPLDSSPPYWSSLYATPERAHEASAVQLGGHRFWRQRSEAYAKYHYAPTPYPDWTNYEVSARVKTISTGGGQWRLLAYNYPADDTAYETYKIEVRHPAGELPQLRIMKGGTIMAAATLSDFGADPYDWNVYAMQVFEDDRAPTPLRRRLVAYVNGRRVAAAVDVNLFTTPDPNEYSQGSVGLTTVGGALGWCEIYMDDLQVRQWQPVMAEYFDDGVAAEWQHLYTTPDRTASSSIVPGREANGWRQFSEAYTKYHYAPSPYPTWQNIDFSADVRTVSFGGGKWRMNGYNYPAGDTAYETYKLEVHAGSGDPLLRIMKGGATLEQATFSSMSISPMDWHDYSLNVHSFQPDGRIINKTSPSAVEEWLAF